jgi:hypothetical protein
MSIAKHTGKGRQISGRTLARHKKEVVAVRVGFADR